MTPRARSAPALDRQRPGRVPAHRRVEERAIAWLARHRGRLDPARAPESAVLLVRKAVAEVSLLLGLKMRSSPEEFGEDYASLLEQVETVAARPSYRELIARDHRAFLLYASTYAGLRLCGRGDDHHRALVEQAAGSRYAGAVERIPFRHLDLLHTLELAGIDHRFPSSAAVAGLTALAADPPLPELTSSEKYAVTHAVFYLTDFGRRPLPAPINRARAIDLVEGLLMIERLSGNADLTGELVCALACLGVVDGREVVAGWRMLAGGQRPDGRVPGPEGILHPDVAPEDAALRAWLASYHSTIVAALTSVVTSGSPAGSGRRRTPPVRLRGDVEGARARCLGWLAADAVKAPTEWAVRETAALAYGWGARSDRPRLRSALAALAHRAGTEAIPWEHHGADTVTLLLRGCRDAAVQVPGLDEFADDVVHASREADAAAIDLQARHRLRALEDARSRRRSGRRVSNGDLRALVCEVAKERTAPSLVALFETMGGGVMDGDEGDDLAESFSLELLEALESYDLARSCVLVRALLFLGWAQRRICRDAIDYLLSQQQPDGSFGYPATDEHGESYGARRGWTTSAAFALSDLAQVRRVRRGPTPARAARV